MTTYTVVARTSGGWRSPPTLREMTLEEAQAHCIELCKRYPNQEFDILGVVAKGTQRTRIKLESIEAPSPKPKRTNRAKAPELTPAPVELPAVDLPLGTDGANVTPLRRPA